MKQLSKNERESVRRMFDGKCAYCGEPLAERWHADHVEPVMREWWKPGGGVEYPERHQLSNFKPACAPCNLDKHSFTLEQWRTKLAGGPGVLGRNSPTYRHSLRFGLVAETKAEVVFHFEALGAVALSPTAGSVE